MEKWFVSSYCLTIIIESRMCCQMTFSLIHIHQCEIQTQTFCLRLTVLKTKLVNKGHCNRFSSEEAKVLKKGTCLKDFQKNNFHIAQVNGYVYPLFGRINMHIDEKTIYTPCATIIASHTFFTLRIYLLLHLF